MARVFANDPGDLCSIPGASYQRLKKRYLTPPCLTLINIRYISRVKWSNPGKGVVPSPTPRCSSYWKGSLQVTLDYGRQLYLLIWRIHEKMEGGIHYSILICTICFHNPSYYLNSVIQTWSFSYFPPSSCTPYTHTITCKQRKIYSIFTLNETLGKRILSSTFLTGYIYIQSKRLTTIFSFILLFHFVRDI